jgi:hypothetical protein
MTACATVRRSVVLLALLAGLAACGGHGGTSSSVTEENAFLLEHNARFNDGRTVRWPNVPIPVFANGIARSSEMAVWTDASGGAVTFTFVGSRPAAGISFRFGAGTDICGVTTVNYTGDGVIVSADVQVVQAIFRSPECVNTVTHETGHAIGFLDHTGDGGLMDDDGGNGEITPPVATMIRTLYAMPPNTPVAVSERPQTLLRPRGGVHTLTFVHPVRR